MANPALRKPADWLQDLANDPTSQVVAIISYDGWRDQPFETPVTEEEFNRRLTICTVQFRRG